MNILTQEPKGENQYGQARTRRRIRWGVVLPVAVVIILGAVLCLHFSTAAEIRAWSIFAILATLNGVVSVWWCSFVGRTLTEGQDGIVGVVGMCVLIGWLVLLFAFLTLIGVVGGA